MEGDQALKKSKAALDGRATKPGASPAVWPGARLFATGELGKPDTQSRTAGGYLSLIFKRCKRIRCFPRRFGFRVGFSAHTVTTSTGERKAIGRSGTLLMAWGLQLCWEAAPVWRPSPSRHRRPQTAPRPTPPPTREHGTDGWQGCRGQPSSCPLAPRALPLLEATLPSGTAPRGLGTMRSPPGTPQPRATPQPKGDLHTQSPALLSLLGFNLHYPPFYYLLVKCNYRILHEP